MRVLHTSDWHIGHQFHGRRRDVEFAAFLSWLSDTVAARGIEVLIVAGDVFDTSAPGNNAVRMYYDFLKSLHGTSCRTVVITGGNHDSPSFLNAPRELLRSAFAIHVFGGAMSDPADELVVVRNTSGEPELLIGAVPYLRDSDLTSMTFGGDVSDHEARLRNGFRTHYKAVADAAERIRGERVVPFILTGHFYLSGGRFGSDDGVREYVGGLAEADRASLPDHADYIALGHLHQPQKVGAENVRYCGSPLKMSFSDTDRRIVYELDFAGRDFSLTEIEVPHFVSIRSLRGTWEGILPELTAIAETEEPVYCRVSVADFSGSELVHKTEELFQGRLLNYPLILQSEKTEESVSGQKVPTDVAKLSEADVFELLLSRKGISGGDAELLRSLYGNAVARVLEKDSE